jgi:eukaryotic-like serine/threonine-protein kinase
VAENAVSAGRVLGDRFELLEKLGQGGMGAVYRAHDRTHGETVAIKVTNDTGEARRFAREAEILARFEHPAIVRYLTHGRTSLGERYLVMEWVEGETLRSVLDRRLLGVRQTLVLGRRLASALAAVHATGLLHRDIKPNNVMIPTGGIGLAKLIDFGIAVDAHALTRLTAPGCVVGTWAYMAPERAKTEQAVDERSDLYSLGCVLYEVLTGRRPSPGSEIADVMTRILWEVPPLASSLWEGTPPALDDLLADLLAKAPEARPPSAAALLQRLEAIALPEEGESIPPPATGRRLNAALADLLPDSGNATRQTGGDEGAITDSDVHSGPATARMPPRLGVERLPAFIVSIDAAALVDEREGAAARELRTRGLATRRLPDGRLVGYAIATGEARDDAVRALTAAVAIQPLLGVRVVVAAGHAHVADGVAVFDELFERAGAIHERAAPAGVDPCPLTAALADHRYRLGARGLVDGCMWSVPVPPGVGRPSLVGRSAERQQLVDRVVQALRDRRPVQIEVAGPIASGKSRLLESLVAAVAAAAPACAHLAGWVAPFEGDAPHAAIARALGLPLTHGCDSVLGVLAEAARGGPLLLVIDDVQWLDQPLDAVLHQLGGLPLAVVGAARRPARNGSGIELAPPTDDDLRALGAAACPGDDPEEALAAAGGRADVFLEHLGRARASGVALTSLIAAAEHRHAVRALAGARAGELLR